MTKTSLTPVTAISSIPLPRISSDLLTKPGRWLRWQVGVNAPGTPIRTTRRPLKNSSVVRVCGPSEVITVNVASGIRSPTLIVICLSTRTWLTFWRANLWLCGPAVEMQREFDRLRARQRKAHGRVGERLIFRMFGEGDEKIPALAFRLDEEKIGRLGEKIRGRRPPPCQAPGGLVGTSQRGDRNVPRGLFSREPARYRRLRGGKRRRFARVLSGHAELQARMDGQADFLTRGVVEIEHQIDRLARLLRRDANR